MRPSNTYLETMGNLVRLRIENIDVDAERFLAEVQIALADAATPRARAERLTAALQLYQGDALADETHALWAERLHREVQSAYFAASHALAETAGECGDHLTRADVYRRVLAVDGFDQRAHEGLIAALGQLGAHGQVAAAREDYTQRMAELGIPVAG
jgi:two-component SAPR family response regulator